MILAKIEVPKHFLVDALICSGKFEGVRKTAHAGCHLRREERERACDWKTAEGVGSSGYDWLIKWKVFKTYKSVQPLRYQKTP